MTTETSHRKAEPRYRQTVPGSGAFLRAAPIYVVGMLLQSGLGIFLLPLTTRILGVEQFGVAGTATAISGLLAVVYGLGLNYSIVRFYYDSPPDAKRADWAALMRLQAVAAAGLALITYATGPLWSSLLGDFGWNGAFKIAVASAWVIAMQGTALGVLRAAERPWTFFSVVLTQLGLGSALGLWLASVYGAAGYVGGLGLGSLAALGIGVVANYRRPAWRWSLPGAGLRLSLPVMSHQLAVWGMDLSDRLLVAAYLGARDVARYQIAYVAGSALTLLLSSIQSAWGPTYMRQTERARRLLPSVLVLPVGAAALCAVALLVIVMPVLLDFLVPSSFGGTTMIVAVVAVSTLPRAAYLMAVTCLVDRKRTGRMATASGLGAILNVGVNLVAIPAFGLIAAATTTALANVVMAVVIIASAQRILQTPMRLPSLLGLWALGAGVAVGLASLPDGAGWVAPRIAVALAALAGLFFAGRSIRRAFRTTTDPDLAGAALAH